MADDGYGWLDEDAAERLLCGEPAVSLTTIDAINIIAAADELTRAGAKRLAAALDDLTFAGPEGRPGGLGCPLCGSPPAPAAGPLPGEEAALAAFRQARTAVRTARPAPPARSSRASGQAARLRWAAWPPGWWTGQRLRAGLAVALVVCALGGITVATGTQVPPTPFRGGPDEPVPVASVSAIEEQEPGSAGPSAGDGAFMSPQPGGQHRGVAGGSGDGADGSGQDILGSDASAKGGSRQEKLRVATALCRAYEEGSLNARTQRRLARAAGGAHAVDGYCGHLLGHDDQSGTSGDTDSGRGGRSARPSRGTAGDASRDGGGAGSTMRPTARDGQDVPAAGTPGTTRAAPTAAGTDPASSASPVATGGTAAAH
jgi:hypothetical protein